MNAHIASLTFDIWYGFKEHDATQVTLQKCDVKSKARIMKYVDITLLISKEGQEGCYEGIGFSVQIYVVNASDCKGGGLRKGSLQITLIS